MSGAARVFPKPYLGRDERPTNGIQERGGGREVWTRGKATYCSTSKLEKVEQIWRSEGKGAVAELMQGEFHAELGKDRRSKETGGDWNPTMDDTRTGRWTSQAFTGYVKSNMEYPLRVSRGWWKGRVAG